MNVFDPSEFEEISAQVFDSQGPESSQTEEEEDRTGDAGRGVWHKPFKQALIIALDVHRVDDLYPAGKEASEGDQDVVSLPMIFHALCGFVKSRIVSNDHDKIGVVLFGTRGKVNKLNVDGITEVHPLSFASIDHLQSLQRVAITPYEEILEDSLPDVKGVHHRDAPEVCLLSSLFRYAARTFKISAPATKFTRRLFLFTARDNPCASVPRDRAVSMQLASDLTTNNVGLELYPLVSGDRSFNLEVFWAPIVSMSEQERLASILQQSNDEVEQPSLETIKEVTNQQSIRVLADLGTILRKRATQNRLMAKVRFRLAPKIVISVGLFLFVRDAKRPSPIMLRANDLKPAKSQTMWLDENTGDLLGRDEMKRVYPCHEKQIFFTDEEMAEIRSIKNCLKYTSEEPVTDDEDGAVHMNLIGFKSMTELNRFRHALKSSVYWVYPIESLVEGSHQLFTCLMHSMTAMNQMMLMWWQFRGNSAPRIFIGVPQVDPSVGVGLYLLPLPFKEELQYVPVESHGTSKEEVEALKEEIKPTLDKVLEALSMPSEWNPSEVSNPNLAKFWWGLEVVALSEENPEPFVDETKPDSGKFEGITEDLRDLASRFRINRETRKADPGGSSPKRTKREAVSEDQIASIRKLAEKKQLDSLKVDDLKNFLATVKLPVSGRKADLIARVTGYFSAE